MIEQLKEENKTLMAHPPYSCNPNDERDAERWRTIRSCGIVVNPSFRSDKWAAGSWLADKDADEYADLLMKK